MNDFGLVKPNDAFGQGVCFALPEPMAQRARLNESPTLPTDGSIRNCFKPEKNRLDRHIMQSLLIAFRDTFRAAFCTPCAIAR